MSSLSAAAMLLQVGPVTSGTFPGGNGPIAYTSGSSVAVVMDDGSGAATIATGQYPSWNADGTKIAYSRSGDLYIADSDGGNETQLTTGSAADREPSWSPDGSQIAFMREESNDRDVAVVVVATQVVTEIITGSFQADYPAWSPGSTKIAYRSNQSGCSSSFCIYVANPDGSGQTELVDSASFRAASQPNWSPDGSKVAFVYDDNPDDVVYSGGVAVVDAAGGTPTALTSDTGVDDGNPAFSPDGTRIAFVRSDAGQGPGALWVMAADGSGAAAVPNTSGALVDLGVSWAATVAPTDPEDSTGAGGSTTAGAQDTVAVTPTLTG